MNKAFKVHIKNLNSIIKANTSNTKDIMMQYKALGAAIKKLEGMPDEITKETIIDLYNVKENLRVTVNNSTESVLKLFETYDDLIDALLKI